MSRNSHIVSTLALTLATTLIASSAVAQQRTYNVPTRGFTLERGGITEEGSAQIDLATGSFAQLGVSQMIGTSGGVRLGTPNSELVLNQSNISGAGTGSDAFLKLGMKPLDAGQNKIEWNVYGGLSYQDLDDGNDYLNIGAGAAFTMKVDGLILNANPQLVLDDSAPDRDTRLQLGFGAHYQLADTEFGRFEPGFEYTVISSDIIDDNLLTAGTRWYFNDRITMDFLILVDSAVTATGLPGFIRLNAAF